MSLMLEDFSSDNAKLKSADVEGHGTVVEAIAHCRHTVYLFRGEIENDVLLCTAIRFMLFIDSNGKGAAALPPRNPPLNR